MNFLEWCITHKTELIVMTVALVGLIVSIVVAVCCVHKRKKRTAKSAVGKILNTTDGFLGNYPTNKKTRHIIVVYQRKIDGAIAVDKIYSLEGKAEKVGKNYIPNLILSPQGHSSLTENSIVGRKVIFGLQTIKNGKKEFQPLYMSDFVDTKDKLTQEELKTVLAEVQNYTAKFRKTNKNTVKKWREGFKRKK